MDPMIHCVIPTTQTAAEDATVALTSSREGKEWETSVKKCFAKVLVLRGTVGSDIW
jgi:hypothetical protein